MCDFGGKTPVGIQGKAYSNLYYLLTVVRSSHMVSVREISQFKVTNRKEKDRKRCVVSKLVRQLDLVMSLHNPTWATVREEAL